MPTYTSLTTGNSASAGTSSNTASISPGANRAVFLWVQAWDNALAAVPTFTISGLGMTWDLVDSITSGGIQRMSLYRCMGSPSTGAITIARSVSSNCSWIVLEVSGVKTGSNGANAIVQVVNNQGAGVTTLTATLAAFADSNNRPLAFGEGEDPNTALGESDFTQIAEINNASGGYNITINAMHKTSVDTTAVVTQTSASFLNIIAVELASQVIQGAFRASTKSLSSGTVSLRVSGGTRASNKSLLAGSVSTTLVGGTRASTRQLFAGSTLPTVGGVTRASTLTLSAGVVSLTVGGATRASALQLFEPTVIGSQPVTGEFRASTLQLYAGVVSDGSVSVAGGTRVSALSLSPGAVAMNVEGGFRPAASQVFAGIVGDIEPGRGDDWPIWVGGH